MLMVIGVAIAVCAFLGVLVMAGIAGRAAVRGKQAAWMAQMIFSLSGAILIGGGLVAMSVLLDVAWPVGLSMVVSGLAVVAYSVTRFRVRPTG